MRTALVLSLLIHALLLSLTFDNQGFGVPGLSFPWRERRFEAGDLRVALVPAQVTGATPALIGPAADPIGPGMAKPEPMAAPGAVAAMTPSPASGPEDVASPPVQAPSLIAPMPSDAGTPVVPVTPLPSTPMVAIAPSATSAVVVTPPVRDVSNAAQKPGDTEVLDRATEPSDLKREQQRAQEQADQMAAAQQEIEVLEAARVDAEREEAARHATVRQEAERAEAARAQTERQEAARLEPARQDLERQKAARAEQEAKREAVLRAIGRQLDEEAARRDKASASSARRGRLFGRTDPNAALILYAEAWSRKIELNMTFDMVREAVKQRHTNPLVTVALRSDGSVESVTFVVSSGVAEIDDAIRRIVQSQAPYRAFPPELVREYDVIEIRRSWYFDMAVRLF